jgi:hypothetical protein
MHSVGGLRTQPYREMEFIFAVPFAQIEQPITESQMMQ